MFMKKYIPNQEEVNIDLGQGWGGRGHDSDYHINIKFKIIRIMMTHADSILNNTRLLKTTKVTVEILLDEIFMPLSVWTKLILDWKLYGF